MKIIIVISLFVLLGLLLGNVQAQTTVGVNGGIYQTFIKGAEPTYGFNLFGKSKTGNNLRLGINLGYYFKTNNDNFKTFVMPITGLFEYRFRDKDFEPYCGVDIGIYRYGYSTKEETKSNGYFGIAPVFGFNYKLSERFFLNSNLKYHYIKRQFDSLTAFSFNIGGYYYFEFGDS